MSSRTELVEAWQRLDRIHLEALATITTSPQLTKTSPKMREFLATCLCLEVNHRENLAVKGDQAPNWSVWSHGQLADGYDAALMIKTAAAGTDERLLEFAEILLSVFCREMSARLTAIEMLEDLCDDA